MNKLLMTFAVVVVALISFGMFVENRRTEHFYSPEFDVTVNLNMSADEADKIEFGYEVYFVNPETREELKFGTVVGRKTAAEKITNRRNYRTLSWWPVGNQERVEGVWIVEVENIP